MDRRFIRRYLGFDPVHQLVRRLHRRLYLRDRRFIRCYCLPCSSSATRPMLLNNAPSVHPTVSFLLLFLLGFDPRKIEYLLNLAYGFLASLGPRNVYKDMLNKMVSPNDHVVINHQNQTQTNGIWGHVRYNLPLFGDLRQHNQSKHKFARIDKIRTTYTCLDAYHHSNSP
jgi:hypothetical protein